MREYPERPIVGIGTVVWDQDRVLLIRRARPPGQGAWSLPGGAQQLGETVYQAAMREVFEETAIRCEVLGLVDVVDSIRRDDDRRVHYHYTLIDLVARAVNTDAQAGSDAADCGWFELNGLQELGLWSETLRIIEKSKRLLKAE